MGTTKIVVGRVCVAAGLVCAAGMLQACGGAGRPVSGPHEALTPPARIGDSRLPTNDAPDIQGLQPGTYAVIDGKPAAVPSIQMGDPATIRRIISEGTQRNRVMEHLTHLCEQIGPRLTASSNAEAANRWTMEQFRSWGLTAEMEAWGEAATRFDRGPSTGRVLRKETRRGEGEQREESWKTIREMELTTLAWTRGTNGPVQGTVVRMPETEDEYAKVKGQLSGAWVLLKPTGLGGRQGVRAGGLRAGDRFKARMEARDKVASGTDPATLAIDERVIFDGVAGFISAPMDERDRVWTTAAPQWRERTADKVPPDVEVIVRLSDYDFINSRLTDGDEFKVEFDIQNTLIPGPITLYNTVAEIRGTTWPDEYVYVMGHMDSWNGPGSQGALDNGTGTATTLEAARLLMAAGAKPKRSIRFCLWTGEEQGLLGAKAHVKANEASWEKISAVFNDDGGTNYQGGLKATRNMVEMLAAATAPVNGWFIDSSNQRPMVVNVQGQEKFPRFASSDHYAFVEVGVPGFFWDEVGRQDYGWSWHTQHDQVGYAIPEYLMQSATCAAVTAYNIACAPTLLPRFEQETEKKDDGAPSIPPAGNAPGRTGR